ncbi:putative E3 ubiquitin-protein ligase HERC4 isoform X11 [Homo sapiens]|uniref:putative E3 ubiquitin-protein ligase HERC4 isoform X11 n=1 Tax=Homo sapiens TaxID=9606 RepID=UPI0003E67B76|nr:probable E3 ubiquitin-protein ligase HERC4 isoform X11 [Homo sapiens]XP_047280956.1 probable E3 ubiquitin-protein ligase HERC4 isoform X11 [Homo sapiens]XP_054221450.1 probable E3 ubiquitin-protein ligase HERC4 isoform X11 [Homo sapiens]XP_054221451.1 probable E3 ubiquitin-protein ligase HERC4 isoform X11 [Homo sapiens]XP_054221452.1 probable E3 ubiquitin-protein ligase HERC4 isoform X11 [Homo sapiens]
MLCWGNASFGQLGLGGIDEEIVLEPRKSDFFINKRVRDVGCGLRHTVFVLDDGTVYTCGCNDLGQLGHEKSRKKPEQVVALDAQNIVAVSCGEAHTLALNDKGQVYAWGLDSDGQLGLVGSEECIRVPRNIKSLSDIQIVQVACGYYHSLALSKASEVFCWGQNKYGQLGLGTDCKKQTSPQLLKSLLGIPFMQVAAGGAHSFVLTLSGAIFGWGRNKFGQLGLNDENDRYVPNLLKSLRSQKIVYICCGEDHTAALTKEGGVFTFGAGGYGQLGHNSTSHEINPRKVFELMGSIVTEIACGRQHTSAFVPSSGRIYSFGLGGNGQLGTGSTSNRKSPFTVKGNWYPYNGQCLPDIDSEEYFCVKRIFSGGDQSFSHYSSPQNCGPPDDFRCPNPTKQIWTVNEALIQKWLSYPSGRFPVEIANEIDGTFSSSGCLNGSFLAVSNDDHYRTGTRFSGVDMNAARLLFHKLIQPDHPQISQQVNEKMGQIIQYDKFYIHEVQELIDIRNDYINWVQQQAYGMLADIPVTICTYPFVFDAQAKTTLLQTDAVLQMQMAIDQAHRQNVSSLFLPVIESVNPCLILVVRRENIVGDAMEVLRKTKNIDYKKPLKVIFVGEDAVDAGGVRKEFFLLIMRELLDPKYGMFRYYEDSRLIWFSDKTFEDSDLFHLIGVICGLAIYNCTIVDLHFPLALYKKLLKKKPSLDDLKELMPDVGRSMQQLLDYPEDDIEETFCLNFTITVENFGATEVKELVLNGADTAVNKQNRQEFVDAYVDYIFNKSVASLFDAFHAGFHKVCGGKVLLLFQPNELQAMVIGNTNYDWKELEKNTEYKGEYWAEHPTIKIFWEVFHELPLEKKKQFLLFLTGSDRIPILGMKSLKLVIQSTGGGEEYLPVSHTCFNLLDLPKYTEKETLRSKLIQAIDHNEGFSLI